MQNNAFYSNITWNLKGRLFTLEQPRVMGILNLTPDSFYSGSRVNEESEVLAMASRMVSQGADLLDIGGYSTRPGASAVDESEELRRVIPAVRLVVQKFPNVPISVDTFRSGVARKAIEAGASIINDVSGGEMDPRMMETAASLGVPYILMHMRGNPGTMNTLADYKDLVKELMDYFHAKVHCLRELGIRDIIIDPGFGFAKNVGHNFELLRELQQFRIFGLPILVGLSRKSMIWRTLMVEPEQALNGTTALHMVALLNGATILRVHDVKEARECIQLFSKMNEPTKA